MHKSYLISASSMFHGKIEKFVLVLVLLQNPLMAKLYVVVTAKLTNFQSELYQLRCKLKVLLAL